MPRKTTPATVKGLYARITATQREAEEAKRRFMALPKADREALLRFLRGL